MAEITLSILDRPIIAPLKAARLSDGIADFVGYRPLYMHEDTSSGVTIVAGHGSPRQGSPSQTVGGEAGAWAQVGTLPVDAMSVGPGGPTPSAWTASGLDRLADYLGEPLGYGTLLMPVAVNDVEAERAFFSTIPDGCGVLFCRSGASKLRVLTPVSLLRALYAAAGSATWEPVAVIDAGVVPGAVAVGRPSVNWYDGSYDAAISTWAWRAAGRAGVSADGRELSFPGGPARTVPLYVYAQLDPWIVGWRYGGLGGSDALAVRFTTHELAARLLAAYGSGNGPEREFALELQRQTPTSVRATVTLAPAGLDLDQWPERVASGANEALLNDLRFGALTGAALRRQVLAAGRRTVFAAPEALSTPGTVRVDRANGSFSTAAYGVLSSTTFEHLTVKPSLVLGACDLPDRADAVQALENLTGCSALDGAARSFLGDPYDHPMLDSSHSLWAFHIAAGPLMARMAVASVVLAARCAPNPVKDVLPVAIAPADRLASLLSAAV